jgi:hypothetical protein
MSLNLSVSVSGRTLDWGKEEGISIAACVPAPNPLEFTLIFQSLMRKLPMQSEQGIKSDEQGIHLAQISENREFAATRPSAFRGADSFEARYARSAGLRCD